ncbi:hypothetical protein L1987_37855 [Smallanthus sonchifolius]|uniref:Uncharacterized protein n=1 Tax=Smallanthus sonchifolius TaxID=185202 RepID=A0ACB9HIW6_9ASTR|nr:hypothetical protein L1987_37855 [Smallanthus sonchifolius]
MIGKAVASLVIFLVTVFITYSITTGDLGSGDLKSQLSFFSLPKNDTPLPCRTGSPLRIFTYDLPKRFNVGQMHIQTSLNEGMVAKESMGLYKMLKPHKFVVLVYSSIFIVDRYGNMVDILKFLRKSNCWHRTSGRDHVIPMHHPNAFRFIREEVNASILIVANFGRFSKSMSSLQKDVVAPYKHVVESFMYDDSSNPFKLHSTLLFFRGRTMRKSVGYILNMYDTLELNVLHLKSNLWSNQSTQGMRSSKFCLRPAGDTPSSNRLFDAIVSHSVTVIVNDHIELPFESELDYTKLSLFFSVKEALVPGYMVEHLRKIPENEWLKMWARLKEITHHFEYQFPPKKEDAVNMIWRQVRSKVHAERLAVNRKQRMKSQTGGD